MTIHHRIGRAEILLTTWIVKAGSQPCRADRYPQALGSRVLRFGVRVGLGPWVLFKTHQEALQRASNPLGDLTQ